MASTPEIAQRLRNALAVAEPDLDTNVGSTARKILDAVAEGIAGAYADEYILSYQYDLDSKKGAALDDFCSLFGIRRLQARRAYGAVTFTRLTPALRNIVIPNGTQVQTSAASGQRVVVQTVVPSMLRRGDTTVSVPVRAVLGGTGGNVAAGALTQRVGTIEGIPSNGITNVEGLTGGLNAESDAELRDRFRKTVFRSLAGTESMYLGTALEHDDVSHANVIGTSKRIREQIEITAGTGTSSVQDARFIYPATSVVGANIDGGQILTPGTHYSLSTAIPPVLSSLDATAMPDGVYEVEFEYAPLLSRNDPATGKLNRIDVYVKGEKLVAATESISFSNSRAFTDATGDLGPTDYKRSLFRRTTGDTPTLGNIFIPLGFTPVSATGHLGSGSLLINGVTYLEGTDYWVVNRVDGYGNAWNTPSGLEWKTLANGATKAVPANGTRKDIDYRYNRVPVEVEQMVRRWRLATTDVKVHQAHLVPLHMWMAVILRPGSSLASVETAVFNAVRDYIDRIGFAGVIQVSDLLNVAGDVSGVDAVRFVTSTDNATDYAIQDRSKNPDVIYASSVTGQTRRAKDVLLGDGEIAFLSDLTLVQRAQNSFGSV